jgi:MFS family permease
MMGLEYFIWGSWLPLIYSALVQALHGICYGFFFATVYIFVDEYFPKDVRACAQGLFNAVILGVGALVANGLCPYLIQKGFTRGEIADFQCLFLVPLVIATLAAMVLALYFRPPLKREPLSALQTALVADAAGCCVPASL